MLKQLTCNRFDERVLQSGTEPAEPDWTKHLEACSDCQAQWQTHRVLVAMLGEDDVPELTPAFQARLERTIAGAIEVRPLRGWRKVAMLAYSAAALGTIGWTLRHAPLPTIDLSAPWLPVAAFVAVPLSLMLAIVASRWLPAFGPRRDLGAFAL